MKIKTCCGAHLFVALLLLFDCSVNYTGGTETGNPVVLGNCLEKAWSIFDTADKWLPSHYLIDESQLSADFSSAYAPKKSLAKYTFAQAEDTVDYFDTIYKIDTLYDTVIRPKLLLINDSIINKVVKSDTVVMSSDGAVIIKKYICYEKVYFIDTLKVEDTLYVKRLDTIGVGNVVPQVAIKLNTDTLRYPVIKVNLETSNTEKYSWYIPSVIYNTYSKVPIVPVKFDTSKVVFSLSRELYASNQKNSYELYTGLDSDSGLYTAANGMPVVNLQGEYRDLTTGKLTTMIVDFDPGTDNSFKNVNDNRIRSFAKSTFQNGVQLEDICYVTKTTSNDTVLLISNKKNEHESDNCIFYTICGTDKEDHNQNVLAFVIRALQNVSDTVKNMKIIMTPDNPVKKGEIPSSVFIVVSLDYGESNTGTLSGRIYYSDKKFTGQYESVSGKCDVRYDFTTKMVTVNEIR